jgi:6-phosphogluconolactonase
MTAQPIVDVAADANALARRVADWLVDQIAATQGRFALSLSGGSTPKRLYTLLANTPYRERIPWQRLNLFWGDERVVPPDHPDSNYRMAREAMIAHVPIPPDQVHPIPTALSPPEAAIAYERTLKSFYGAETLDPARPLFNLTLLGLGPDGHTASLFPGTSALDERKAWVVSVVGAKPEPRITLTFPLIESSLAVAFLVAGAEKRAVVTRLRQGDAALPAARVKAAGELRWFLDHAAAGAPNGSIGNVRHESG